MFRGLPLLLLCFSLRQTSKSSIYIYSMQKHMDPNDIILKHIKHKEYLEIWYMPVAALIMTSPIQVIHNKASYLCITDFVCM